MCNRGGKNFFSLFKWIGATQSKFDELKRVLGNVRRVFTEKKGQTVDCELPKEFIPLWEIKEDDFFWRACMKYLRGRGIHAGDILKYGIGYCTRGVYENMVIIPSYDSTGKLNYFTSRAFMDSVRMKFKNPPVPKDVVGFDLMINWDEPIILVESAFDAIAIRRNAIPLYGKTISNTLRQKIIEKNVRSVNICLDADAISNAIDHAQWFVANGIDVTLTELSGDDDPSSLGYTEIWKALNSSKEIDEDSLFERQLKDHLHGEGKTRLPHRRRTLQTFSTSQRVSGSFQKPVRGDSRRG